MARVARILEHFFGLVWRKWVVKKGFYEKGFDDTDGIAPFFIFDPKSFLSVYPWDLSPTLCNVNNNLGISGEVLNDSTKFIF